MGEIGQRLQAAREAQHLSLRSAAKRLKINEKYLRALEEENFSELPQGAYIFGFLRNYANYLRLDYDELKRLYEEHYNPENPVPVLPGEKDKKETRSFVLTSGKVIGFLVVVASGLLLWYLFFQYQALTASPDLAVYLPRDGEVHNTRTIRIVGQTIPDATLLINGEEVNLSREGEFERDFVALRNGPAQIEIVARNRISGRETREVRTFTVDLPASELLSPEELAEEGEEAGLPVSSEGDGESTAVSVAEGDGVELVIRVVDRVWFSARLDGGSEQEFILDPGQTRVLTAEQTVALHSGKAYATYVSLNGAPEEVMAETSVSRRTWSSAEE